MTLEDIEKKFDALLVEAKENGFTAVYGVSDNTVGIVGGKGSLLVFGLLIEELTEQFLAVNPEPYVTVT